MSDWTPSVRWLKEFWIFDNSSICFFYSIPLHQMEASMVLLPAQAVSLLVDSPCRPRFAGYMVSLKARRFCTLYMHHRKRCILTWQCVIPKYGHNPRPYHLWKCYPTMNRTTGLCLTHHPTVVSEYATRLNRDVSWIEKKGSAVSENSDLRGRQQSKVCSRLQRDSAEAFRIEKAPTSIRWLLANCSLYDPKDTTRKIPTIY